MEDGVNTVAFKWELFRGVTEKWIQESFGTISANRSSACVCRWECHAETLAKAGYTEQPTYREVIWIVGQKGAKGKTFLQNYIKYCYSDRYVITTDIATNAKNLAHFLTKFPLECKDIFLFNHPCSTAETVAYDMLEGVKDGYKVSAKYGTQGLVFKTPNIVIVFSNGYPRTEALKKDCWWVYEIIDEDLCDKLSPSLNLDDWHCCDAMWRENGANSIPMKGGHFNLLHAVVAIMLLCNRMELIQTNHMTFWYKPHPT